MRKAAWEAIKIGETEEKVKPSFLQLADAHLKMVSLICVEQPE